MKYFVLLVLILLMAVLSGCEPDSVEHDRDLRLLDSNPQAYLMMQLIRECGRAASNRRAEACFEALEALEGFNVIIQEDNRNK